MWTAWSWLPKPQSIQAFNLWMFTAIYIWYWCPYMHFDMYETGYFGDSPAYDYRIPMPKS